MNNESKQKKFNAVANCYYLSMLSLAKYIRWECLIKN